MFALLLGTHELVVQGKSRHTTSTSISYIHSLKYNLYLSGDGK